MRTAEFVDPGSAFRPSGATIGVADNVMARLDPAIQPTAQANCAGDFLRER